MYNQSGYPIADSNHNQQSVRTYREIQKVFLGYEGNTPEKIVCQKDWEEVVKTHTLLRNAMISLEEAMTKNPQPKNFILDEKETEFREKIRQIFSENIKGKTDKQAIEFIKSQYDERISIILEANNTITTSKLVAVQALLMIGEIEGRKGVKPIKDRSTASPKDEKIIDLFEKLIREGKDKTDAIAEMAGMNDLGVNGKDFFNSRDMITKILQKYGLALDPKKQTTI